jgi:hypothetical protein
MLHHITSPMLGPLTARVITVEPGCITGEISRKYEAVASPFSRLRSAKQAGGRGLRVSRSVAGDQYTRLGPLPFSHLALYCSSTSCFACSISCFASCASPAICRVASRACSSTCCCASCTSCPWMRMSSFASSAHAIAPNIETRAVAKRMVNLFLTLLLPCGASAIAGSASPWWGSSKRPPKRPQRTARGRGVGARLLPPAVPLLAADGRTLMYNRTGFSGLHTSKIELGF